MGENSKLVRNIKTCVLQPIKSAIKKGKLSDVKTCSCKAICRAIDYKIRLKRL